MRKNTESLRIKTQSIDILKSKTVYKYCMNMPQCEN